MREEVIRGYKRRGYERREEVIRGYKRREEVMRGYKRREGTMREIIPGHIGSQWGLISSGTWFLVVDSNMEVGVIMTSLSCCIPAAKESKKTSKKVKMTHLVIRAVKQPNQTVTLSYSVATAVLPDVSAFPPPILVGAYEKRSGYKRREDMLYEKRS